MPHPQPAPDVVLREDLSARSREQRIARGKAARQAVSLEAHADFRTRADRDPVAVLVDQERSRVADLVPIRHSRMLVSPFTFFRGAAAVMAADLSTTPATELRTQLCGDAHLLNFGTYASPERRLVFDINDFDETLPGPFEWDVKRLAASFVIAGRSNGFARKQCRKAALTAVAQYRTALRSFAEQPILDVWYAHLEIEQALAEFKSSLSKRKRKTERPHITAAEQHITKAHVRDRLQAVTKLTTIVDGRRRIVSQPPLVVPIDELVGVDIDTLLALLRKLIASYRSTLQSDRGVLLDQFALTDVAHKVVGVGSVGLRTWILLFESGVEGESLLLQAKQAEQSVLARYAGASKVSNQGERVVAGQHLMQASSDIFLGAVRAGPHHGPHDDYYLRQLRDWKFGPQV